MLTKKQKNLLIFINEKLKRTGISPSYDEMRMSLNLKSKSGIHRLISALEERGFIKRLPHKARALEVIKLPENAGAQDLYNNFSPKIIKGGLDLNKIDDEEVFIPVLGKIAAGVPIEALENQTENLPLSKSFLGSNEYFALKVEGDSMINAGINTGVAASMMRRKAFSSAISMRAPFEACGSPSVSSVPSGRRSERRPLESFASSPRTRRRAREGLVMSSGKFGGRVPQVALVGNVSPFSAKGKFLH
jgi:SOS-response transcriptional repressor LexA